MLAKDVDVEALESSVSLLSAKYTKKTTTTTTSSKSETSPRATAAASPRSALNLFSLLFSALKLLAYILSLEEMQTSMHTV